MTTTNLLHHMEGRTDDLLDSFLAFPEDFRQSDRGRRIELRLRDLHVELIAAVNATADPHASRQALDRVAAAYDPFPILAELFHNEQPRVGG